MPHGMSAATMEARAIGEAQYDPDLKTEIEVRFIAERENATRVELEHAMSSRDACRKKEVERHRKQCDDWCVVASDYQQ